MPTTHLPATASPADTAQVLEDAADQLLIHGRCRDRAFGDDGSLCVIAALVNVRGRYKPAKAALEAHLEAQGSERFLVLWNRDTEDDDVVRDTLLLVAKDLRGQAVPA